MLQSLVELARQTSADSRRDVLHAVSRLFIEGADAHNARELALFGDILTRLLDQVVEEDRLVLSRRIAHASQTPRELAIRLAYDESVVAAPVLEFSPVLTVPDLVDIARETSQGHLMAIARRVGILEPVTDIIVGRGELLVLNTVARNLTARLSLEGLDQIGARAIVDPLLGDALSLRPDLPLTVARKILSVLQPEARQRVDLILQADGDRVADLMDQAMHLLSATRSDQDRHRTEVRGMLLDIHDRRRKLDDAIDELVFERRLADIAMLLANLADVPESHVSSALHKVNAIAIGVICRTLGLSDPTFRRLCSLRCEKLRLPLSQADQMLRDYAGIDIKMAEKSLRYHKVRDNLQGLARL
jgi:uncharacterized protein (DUF2336 family)